MFAVVDIIMARNSPAERGGTVNPVLWVFEGSKVCDGYDPEGNVFNLEP